MAETSVERKVRELIADQLGIAEEDITLEATLEDDLGADSLDLVELFLSFEEEFELDIPEETAERLETVGDIVTHVEQILQ
ncbi:MAG: acyl carrier protein [Deltaproteobacteria bacterium]|nr:acyl carrier protein [Deltaproteobacteria bacterium]